MRDSNDYYYYYYTPSLLSLSSLDSSSQKNFAYCSSYHSLYLCDCYFGYLSYYIQSYSLCYDKEGCCISDCKSVSSSKEDLR